MKRSDMDIILRSLICGIGLVCVIQFTNAQTLSDSLAIVNAQWMRLEDCSDGINARTATFDMLLWASEY